MKIFALCLLFAGLVVSGCRRHDWRELVIEIPDMHNEAAIRLVMQAIGQGPGIKPNSVLVDPQARKVRFEYDSLLAADMNFIHLVMMAGFEANGLPGDPAARAKWPAEVRP
jgi:hypothetical protein